MIPSQRLSLDHFYRGEFPINIFHWTVLSWIIPSNQVSLDHLLWIIPSKVLRLGSPLVNNNHLDRFRFHWTILSWKHSLRIFHSEIPTVNNFLWSPCLLDNPIMNNFFHVVQKSMNYSLNHVSLPFARLLPFSRGTFYPRECPTDGKGKQVTEKVLKWYYVNSRASVLHHGTYKMTLKCALKTHLFKAYFC